MGVKRFRNYIEKVKELNVVLQQSSNYNGLISESEIEGMNANVEFFNNIRKLIDSIKKHYSTSVNVSLDDIVLYHMKDYYLLYSIENKNNIWCYDLEGNVLWKSNENVRFIYETGEDFAISVSNESLDEFESSGCIWRFMTYKDNKIRRIPNVVIEDVLDYKELSENLIELKFIDDKVSIFDKKLGQIIIGEVDKVERPCEETGVFNKNNSFLVAKKVICDTDIDCQFYIDNYGYIISDLCDSKCRYSLIFPDKCDKLNYNKNLNKIYEVVTDICREKTKQLVK